MSDNRKRKLMKKRKLKPLKKPSKESRFDFDISEVFEYDVPNMKPLSHLDVLRNPRLLKANLPGKQHPDNVRKSHLYDRDPMQSKKRVKGKRSKLKRKKKLIKEEEEGNIEENKSLASISAQLPYLKDVFIGDWTPSQEFMEETNKLFYKNTQKSKLDRRKTNVAPDDQEEISKLKTGEDAVAFFSKAGKNTAVKFLYLNRRGAYKGESIEEVRKREYMPYSMVVVPREKVNPEYFTMSASGVVHIQPKQPTEYMSLSDWMKESTMFKVLRRIRFFKFYLSYKCFKIWHRNSRFKNFCKRRAKLHRELFLSKKTFCSKLLELREECYRIQDEPLMNLGFNPKEGKNGVFEENTFMKQQSKTRVLTSETFQNRKIDSSLQDLCRTVGSRTRLEGIGTPEAIKFYLFGKDIPQEESKPISAIKKSKSMYETQQEEMDKQLALEKAYREQMMLGDFIRLCDYMSVESFISLCKNTMITLYDEMKVDDLDPTAKRIMFSVEITFNFDEKSRGELKYSPTENTMTNIFQKNSEDLIDVVAKVTPLIKYKGFRNYFEEDELKKLQWKISQAIASDEVYVHYERLIYDLIKESFRQTYDFGSKFENLQQEFVFVKEWKSAAVPYQERQHDHSSFEESLDYVVTKLMYLTKAQSKKDCDVFRVDSTGLKTYLEPELKAILSTIKKTIHLTSYNLMYSLKQDLESKILVLKERPTLLPEFVDFLEKLKEITREDKELKERYEEIKKVYLLSQSNRDRTRGSMHTSDMKIEGRLGTEELDPDELKEQLDDFMMSFDKELTMANELKRERIQIQEDELDSCINKVEGKLAEYVRLLRSETFTSVVTNQTTPQILESLTILGQEIEETKEETERYNRFKWLISENEKLEWDNLAKVEELYKLRKDIWETLHLIETKTNKWMSTEVSALPSDRINRIIQKTFEHVIHDIQPELDRQFALEHDERGDDEDEDDEEEEPEITLQTTTTVAEDPTKPEDEQKGEEVDGEKQTVTPTTTTLEEKVEGESDKQKKKSTPRGKKNKVHKDAVVEDLLQLLTKWRKRKTVISDIGNKELKGDHWERIFEIIDKNNAFPSLSGVEGENNTLNRLDKMKIFDFEEEIHEISMQATGEAMLRSKVAEIQKKWNTTEFSIKPYRDKKDLYILGSCEDVFDLLEEHLTSLQMMQGNEYITGVKGDVDRWEITLSEVSDVIEELLSVQKKWVYFEHIFDSDDLKKQLHIESAKFNVVNRKFTNILSFALQNRNVLANTTRKMGEDQNVPLLTYLKDCNEWLEDIQQSLDLFLRTKRDHFPRFYFLSNDELLEILSQVKNPRMIQRHLKKCFENMESVTFKKEGSREVVGMESVDGEIVQFSESLFAVPNIEFWLMNIESSMIATLRERMRDTLHSHDEMGRREWIQDEKFPAQCLLTVDKIIWTREIERAFAEMQSGDNTKALKEYRDRFQSYIRLLVDMVKDAKITRHQKMLLNNLILLNVHSLEVISQLIEIGCSSVKDFEWSAQLRHYFEENTNTLSVHQINAQFEYGFEYLGNSPRLVITPLTERCILTCTSALSVLLGACAQGPSGVGKTETIKDFSKTLARQCVVFNCSEGLNISMMNRMFTGLAQAGAWACFDEFNRLEVNVLSVIAQYMQIIQKSLIARNRNFIFETRDILLNFKYGVFITMNPNDEFGGEEVANTKLPDNLKTMFRPVSMIEPDTALICENMLFSEGFMTASVLAQKLNHLYKLGAQQCSKQDHYDFGLRALKSVLVMAGEIKRSKEMQIRTSSPSTSGGGDGGTSQQQKQAKEESDIIVSAILEANLAKFLKNDLDLFCGFVQDLFPSQDALPNRRAMTTTAMGSPIAGLGLTGLKNTIENEISKLGYQRRPEFVRKVIQLHKVLSQRHATMIVGDVGVGKSTLIDLLSRANNTLSKRQIQMNVHKSVTCSVVHPKSFGLGELYGVLNETTLEWKDGIVPKLTRAAEKDFDLVSLTSSGNETNSAQTGPIITAGADHGSHQHWIVFDGPVDSFWIENMNTALDNNKVLCLTNGERIKVPENVRFLFEVTNLSYASPSTISRCGMVVLETHHLNEPWSCVLETWLENFASKAGDRVTTMIKELCELFVPDTLSHLREECEETIESVDINIVQSFCNLMDVVLIPSGLDIEKQTLSFFVDEDDEDFEKEEGGDEKEGLEGRKMSSIREIEAEETEGEDENVDNQIASGEEGKQLPSADRRRVKTLHVQPLQLIKMNFIFAYIWSFGSNITSSFRTTFDFHSKSLIELAKVDFPIDRTVYDYFVDLKRQSWRTWASLIPSEVYEKTIEEEEEEALLKEKDGAGTISTKYDQVYSPGNILSSFSSSNSSTTIDQNSYNVVEKILYDDFFVPTKESIRMNYLMDLIIKKSDRKNILISGPRGVGKTKLIKYYLDYYLGDSDSGDISIQSTGSRTASPVKRGSDNSSTRNDGSSGTSPLSRSYFTSTNIQMTSNITSKDIVSLLHSRLPGKSKKQLGDRYGKTSIVFLEDLNLPKPESMETKVQPPLEFLRQIIDQQGYYDLDKLFFKKIVNTFFIGEAMPSGHKMDRKFTRHFHLLHFDALGKDSMKHIFGTILKNYFLTSLVESDSTVTVRETATSVRIGTDENSGSIITTRMVELQLRDILNASIGLYERIREELKPCPATMHYVFNVRDLSQVMKGMLLLNHDELKSSKDVLWKLWIHETSRVFRDRLVSLKDRQWFDNCQKSLIRNFLPSEFLQNTDFSRILFGTYLFRGENTNYDSINYEDEEFLKEELDQHLQDYRLDNDLTSSSMGGRVPSSMPMTPNDSSMMSPMKDSATEDGRVVSSASGGGGIGENYVFFKDAIMHLSSLCRILKQKRGNALLIGMDGSGRKTLTRLASFILGLECFEVDPNLNMSISEGNQGASKLDPFGPDSQQKYGAFDSGSGGGDSFDSGYGSTSSSSSQNTMGGGVSDYERFRVSLKRICLSVGCDDKKYAVIITENLLSNPLIMESVHTLIKTGDIYDKHFFENEDIERILKEYGTRLRNSLSQSQSTTTLLEEEEEKRKRKAAERSPTEEFEEGEDEEKGEEKKKKKKKKKKKRVTKKCCFPKPEF